MEYVKISEVDTVSNGFIIEFQEIEGHYIYVAPNPPRQPDSAIYDEASDEVSDEDDEIIWF